MEKGKNKNEALLEDLIAQAKQWNIEVRTEKLLREVGYHVHSGRCRLKGKELIIINRDAAIRDRVDFLAEELRSRQSKELPLTPKKPVGKRVDEKL
jgi:hypothetical protein